MSGVKDLLRPVLGPMVRELRERRAARQLVGATAGLADHGALFDAVMASPFAPLQKKSEFTTLMTRAAAPPPRAVVEIGSFNGGTAFLLTRIAADDAVIVMADDQFAPRRQRTLRGFARAAQRITTVRGDSHSDALAERIRAALGGRPIDVLFVDGDHRYEGVKRDFDLYAPLVRPGGLIAFHDIVPDRRAREGAETTADAGGVPRFWRELRARQGANATESIDDPAQDACGIGMLYWRP